jgi:hypothetical protein
MGLYTRTVEVSTAGGAGAAAGEKTLGFGAAKTLRGVFVDYRSQAATTDVTITNQGRTILALTNQNTDKYVAPREVGVDSAGAALGVGESTRYEAPVLFGAVTITVAEGNDGDPGVVVTFIYEE